MADLVAGVGAVERSVDGAFGNGRERRSGCIAHAAHQLARRVVDGLADRADRIHRKAQPIVRIVGQARALGFGQRAVIVAVAQRDQLGLGLSDADSWRGAGIGRIEPLFE